MAVSKTVTRLLTVSLSDAELLNNGRKLASILNDIEDKEENAEAALESAKAHKAEVKSEVKKLKSDIAKLKYSLVTGFEDRDIECVWEPNFDTGQMFLIRKDNWTVIERRPMTQKEKQIPLFDQTSTQDATATSTASKVLPIDKNAKKKEDKKAKEKPKESSLSEQPGAPVPAQAITDGVDLSHLKSSGIILTHFKSGDFLIISLELDGHIKQITAEEYERAYIKYPDYATFDTLQDAALKHVQKLSSEALVSLFNDLKDEAPYKSSDSQPDAVETTAAQSTAISKENIEIEFILRLINGQDHLVLFVGDEERPISLHKLAVRFFGDVWVGERAEDLYDATWKRITKAWKQTDLKLLWDELAPDQAQPSQSDTNQAEIDAAMMEAAAEHLQSPQKDFVLVAPFKHKDGLWWRFIKDGQVAEASPVMVFNLLNPSKAEGISLGEIEHHSKQLINDASQAVLLGCWKEFSINPITNQPEAAAPQSTPENKPKNQQFIKVLRKADGTILLTRKSSGENRILYEMRVKIIEETGWQIDGRLIKNAVQNLSDEELELAWKHLGVDYQQQKSNVTSMSSKKKSPGKGKGKETSI